MTRVRGPGVTPGETPGGILGATPERTPGAPPGDTNLTRKRRLFGPENWDIF